MKNHSEWKLQQEPGNPVDLDGCLHPHTADNPYEAVRIILTNAVTAHCSKDVIYDPRYMEISKLSEDLYKVSYGGNRYLLHRIFR
jgi:hypothetical protein